MLLQNSQAFGLSALFLASIVIGGPLSADHVVHERRGELLRTWRRLDKVHPDRLLPVRIGLTQGNLNKGHDMLMEVSNPYSPRYGKYYTAEEVHDIFAPTQETVNAVVSWIESTGLDSDRVSLSTNKQWIQFEATSGQLGSLLKTHYYEWEHIASGYKNLACDEYSIPSHLREHIDYITPGIKLHTLSERDKLNGKSYRPSKARSVSAGQRRPPAFHGIKYCAHDFVPECIKATYRIPEPNKTPLKGNEFGIYGLEPDLYNQEDADKYFKYYYPKIPQGTAPEILSINGVNIKFNKSYENDGESNLDYEVAAPLIYPQKIKIFQVSDLKPSSNPKSDPNGDDIYRGWFNTFLDAIDGSYCNYESNGIKGDSPGIDPKYPNNSTWKHPHQCGVYKPTNVISISYGHAEAYLPTNYIKRQCNEYMKLGLQGVSILYCTQDAGVKGAVGGKKFDCLGKHGQIFAPVFPASCPYVTAVGATVFKDKDADITNHTQESGAIFSGGGFSNIFPTPEYQKAAVSTFLDDHTPPHKSYNTTNNKNLGKGGGIFNRGGRGIPDVSAIGDYFVDFSAGYAAGDSGTSVSTPIVAAMLNLINEERLAKGKSTVGFVNPTFYAHEKMFHDITKGHNYGCGPFKQNNIGFNASRGWDPITGLGTPDYPSMLKVFMSLP